MFLMVACKAKEVASESFDRAKRRRRQQQQQEEEEEAANPPGRNANCISWRAKMSHFFQH